MASALFFFSLKMGEATSLREEMLSSSASSEPNYPAICLHQEPQVHLEFRCIIFKEKTELIHTYLQPQSHLYHMP